MSIKAILFSKFDPQEGPKIVHQVPENSVITNFDTSASASTSTLSTAPLLSFATISRFLIPRQSLCGNLISLTPPRLTSSTPQCTILSYPICIQSSHYPRNEFIFNFALVLSPPDAIDVPSYKSVVTKLAHLMRSLEEQSHFLSDDASPPGSGKIYSLCEMLMEDLNNYCECMIPIDEFNTLNIKLFPTLPNPAPVKAWFVPLFTVRIETLMDENWDLTMQRIIPFINGVNSVKRIAGLADADIRLTKKCIRHLLYYGCVLLLDIFSFNAIYAPTAEFGNMIASDAEMQAECARYVNTAFEPGRMEVAVSAVGEVGSATSMRSSNITDPRTISLMEEDFWPLTSKGEVVDGVGIVQLFANLEQGKTVREWYIQNEDALANIDIRRFVTFGIIKGFLYRVHRYAIQLVPEKERRNNDSIKKKISRNGTAETRQRREPTTKADQKKWDSSTEGDDNEDSEDEDRVMRARLVKYLDGTHCFDEICTDLSISEKELINRLNKPELGEVVVICK